MRLLAPILTIAALTGQVLGDGAAIIKAMDEIKNDLSALNSTVASWNGDLLGTLGIISKSNAVLDTLSAATSTAKASATLSQTEAVSVADATESLVVQVQGTLGTIKAAKPKFVKLSLTGTLLSTLKQQKTAADGFSAAVVAKVPGTLQAMAQTLVGQLDTAFDDAISTYS